MMDEARRVELKHKEEELIAREKALIEALRREEDIRVTKDRWSHRPEMMSGASASAAGGTRSVSVDADTVFSKIQPIPTLQELP